MGFCASSTLNHQLVDRPPVNVVAYTGQNSNRHPFIPGAFTVIDHEPGQRAPPMLILVLIATPAEEVIQTVLKMLE